MNKQKAKAIDQIDNVILHLIDAGGGSLTYLSAVLDMPKQTLHNRVYRLAELGLAESVENKQKYLYRKYTITEDGRALIDSSMIMMNLLYLKLSKYNEEPAQLAG